MIASEIIQYIEWENNSVFGWLHQKSSNTLSEKIIWPHESLALCSTQSDLSSELYSEISQWKHTPTWWECEARHTKHGDKMDRFDDAFSEVKMRSFTSGVRGCIALSSFCPLCKSTLNLPSRLSTPGRSINNNRLRARLDKPVLPTATSFT